MAESLTRGMRVIVSGRLRQRSYETKEGEKRTVYEVEVDEIGPLAAERLGQGPEGHPRQGRQRRPGRGGRGQQAADPWAGEAPGGFSDEPPF